MKHAEKNFSCEKCNLKYHKKAGLNKHMVNVHSKDLEKTFVCEFCDVTFYMLRLLNRHKFKVHNLSEFRCDDCSKNFKSKIGLIRHCVSVHKGESEFIWKSLCHSVEIQVSSVTQIFHEIMILTFEKILPLQKIPYILRLPKNRKVTTAINVKKNSIPNKKCENTNLSNTKLDLSSNVKCARKSSKMHAYS